MSSLTLLSDRHVNQVTLSTKSFSRNEVHHLDMCYLFIHLDTFLYFFLSIHKACK